MTRWARVMGAAVLALFACGGCHRKCDHWNCTAENGTRLKVPFSTWTITPPKGWDYDLPDDAILAQAGKAPDKAVMGVMSHGPKLPERKGISGRAFTLTILCLKQAIRGSFCHHGIQGPAARVFRVAGHDVKLYRFPGSKYGRVPGTADIFTSTLASKKYLLVLALVPDGDTKSEPLIEASIRSLKNGP